MYEASGDEKHRQRTKRHHQCHEKDVVEVVAVGSVAARRRGGREGRTFVETSQTRVEVNMIYGLQVCRQFFFEAPAVRRASLQGAQSYRTVSRVAWQTSASKHKIAGIWYLYVDRRTLSGVRFLPVKWQAAQMNGDIGGKSPSLP